MQRCIRYCAAPSAHSPDSLLVSLHGAWYLSVHPSTECRLPGFSFLYASSAHFWVPVRFVRRRSAASLNFLSHASASCRHPSVYPLTSFCHRLGSICLSSSLSKTFARVCSLSGEHLSNRGIIVLAASAGSPQDARSALPRQPSFDGVVDSLCFPSMRRGDGDRGGQSPDCQCDECVLASRHLHLCDGAGIRVGGRRELHHGGPVLSVCPYAHLSRILPAAVFEPTVMPTLSVCLSVPLPCRSSDGCPDLFFVPAQRVRSGNFPVVASNHTLVLHWNECMVPLLQQIAMCRAERGPSAAFDG
jgi:hypothetical protein